MISLVEYLTDKFSKAIPNRQNTYIQITALNELWKGLNDDKKDNINSSLIINNSENSVSSNMRNYSDDVLDNVAFSFFSEANTKAYDIADVWIGYGRPNSNMLYLRYEIKERSHDNNFNFSSMMVHQPTVKDNSSMMNCNSSLPSNINLLNSNINMSENENRGAEEGLDFDPLDFLGLYDDDKKDSSSQSYISSKDDKVEVKNEDFIGNYYDGTNMDNNTANNTNKRYYKEEGYMSNFSEAFRTGKLNSNTMNYQTNYLLGYPKYKNLIISEENFTLNNPIKDVVNEYKEIDNKEPIIKQEIGVTLNNTNNSDEAMNIVNNIKPNKNQINSMNPCNMNNSSNYSVCGSSQNERSKPPKRLPFTKVETPKKISNGLIGNSNNMNLSNNTLNSQNRKEIPNTSRFQQQKSYFSSNNSFNSTNNSYYPYHSPFPQYQGSFYNNQPYYNNIVGFNPNSNIPHHTHNPHAHPHLHIPHEAVNNQGIEAQTPEKIDGKKKNKKDNKEIKKPKEAKQEAEERPNTRSTRNRKKEIKIDDTSPMNKSSLHEPFKSDTPIKSEYLNPHTNFHMFGENDNSYHLLNANFYDYSTRGYNSNIFQNNTDIFRTKDFSSSISFNTNINHINLCNNTKQHEEPSFSREFKKK